VVKSFTIVAENELSVKDEDAAEEEDGDKVPEGEEAVGTALGGNKAMCLSADEDDGELGNDVTIRDEVRLTKTGIG
jgi:hypothetical protein